MADRDPQGLRRQLEQRLQGTAPGGDPFDAWIAGLSPEQTAALRGHLPGDFARAAVMVPLVERPEGLTVLLTQRASHLKNHPGQISFPGGSIEPHDAGPWEAALRETREEIGLEPGFASLAGFLHDHMVLTGYLITPAPIAGLTGAERLLIWKRNNGGDSTTKISALLKAKLPIIAADSTKEK